LQKNYNEQKKLYNINNRKNARKLNLRPSTSKKQYKKNSECKGIPLKKIGFQKKNGTKPHFRKIQNKKLNQRILFF